MQTTFKVPGFSLGLVLLAVVLVLSLASTTDSLRSHLPHKSLDKSLETPSVSRSDRSTSRSLFSSHQNLRMKEGVPTDDDDLPSLEPLTPSPESPEQPPESLNQPPESDDDLPPLEPLTPPPESPEQPLESPDQPLELLVRERLARKRSELKDATAQYDLLAAQCKSLKKIRDGLWARHIQLNTKIRSVNTQIKDHKRLGNSDQVTALTQTLNNLRDELVKSEKLVEDSKSTYWVACLNRLNQYRIIQSIKETITELQISLKGRN